MLCTPNVIGNIKESFDNHPRFTIPETGYTLDLSKPPPESDHFQTELESLRRNLKKPTSKKFHLFYS